MPYRSQYSSHSIPAISATSRCTSRRCACQLQGQFPGKQASTFRLGLKRLMQALLAILRLGFTFGLGQQWIEMVEGFAQIGVRVEKQFQSVFMSLVGRRHVFSL